MKSNDGCCGAFGEGHLERLYEYLDGALTQEDVEAVRRHLEDCPDCHEQAAFEQLIRSEVRRCCQEKAPEQLHATIRMRMTQIRITRYE